MKYTNKHPSYTYQKDSYYYFSRAVPFDLRDHYSTSRLVICLHTKSRYRAKLTSKNIASKLDDYWLGLRLKRTAVPARDKLIHSGINPSSAPLLSEAQERYLALKGADRSQLFFSHTRRAIKYVSDQLGDRPIDQFSGIDAANFRDNLKARGLATSSIKRVITSVKAVINFNINEFGIECKNAFANVYIENRIEPKNRTIPLASVRKIQSASILEGDDLRLIIALISDTGMRLSEAVGLRRDDLVLDHEFPHVDLKVNEARRLKTSSSTRKIPLIGTSLQAATAIHIKSENTFCFPNYAGNGFCKTNSASAAANKWIKKIAGSDSVIHGLRHSFRDRLRNKEVPTEVIDQLGGWSFSSIGQSYGEGYNLKVLQKYIERIID